MKSTIGDFIACPVEEAITVVLTAILNTGLTDRLFSPLLFVIRVFGSGRPFPCGSCFSVFGFFFRRRINFDVFVDYKPIHLIRSNRVIALG